MLKVFLGFGMSVVVLLSSAYVPIINFRTYATSANVLITHIQAGGVGAATQEFIVIYNNGIDEVDISGWCLTNKNNATIACFSSPGTGHETYLPAHGHAIIASSPFAITQPIGTVTLTYTPISQSSGSITGGSDIVSLMNHLGEVIDRQAWTTSISGGMQFERHGSGTPVVYNDTDTGIDWSITLPGVLPVDETDIDTTAVDSCPNIESIQSAVPAGKQLSLTGECVDRIMMQIDITELLPNAAGSDEGQEFIELFNPNDVSIDLLHYRLLIGQNYESIYPFPVNSIIQPNEYASFSNRDISFSLLNSSSRVAIIADDDEAILSETALYKDPPDGQSWAFINDTWQYTNRPTPGRENLIMDESLLINLASAQQPCATNQYRSPETNRCRLIATNIGTVTPCKDGQYRSEETNRCRNIATDAKVVTPCDEGEERNVETNRCRKIVVASVAAPCKEGQERNPDTNRCRTVTKMPNANYGVLGAKTDGSGRWYVWAAVGVVLLLALGYAVWEWHNEIGKFSRKQYRRILKFARLRK